MFVDKVGGSGPAGWCSLADTHGASARGPALQSPMRPLTDVTGLIQEPGVEFKPGTAPRAAAAVTSPGVPLLGASDGGGMNSAMFALRGEQAMKLFLTWSAPRGMAIAPV